MELYNGTICITHSQLLDYITMENIKKLVCRNQIKRVVRGCRNTPALYSVDSLPPKIKAELYKRYPMPQETKRGADFASSIELVSDAVRYYYAYRLADGSCLPEDKQVLYANTVSILEAISKWRTEGTALRKRLGKGAVTLEAVLRLAVEAWERISEEYPSTLKPSLRGLRRNYDAYLEGGYESVIHAGYGNKNSRKVETAEQEQALAGILSHHNNLDNAQVASYYNEIAEAQGWKPLTTRAVGQWRERWVLEMERGRKGVKHLRNHRTMQAKRTRPTAPLLYWTLDGWDVELFYQATKVNSKGHRITTYSNRLVMVVVLDPHGDYPVGYAIGDSESAGLIKQAIRNALVHTRELFGQMYHPHQVQSDNFGRGALTEVYKGISNAYTPAQVGNAKSKVVEPYFAYLNKNYCQHCLNWSGFGIKAKRQVNDEQLNLVKRNFPTRDELIGRIHEMMKRERAIKVETYRTGWAKLEAGKKLELSMEMYLGLFGETTGHRNMLTGSGLHPTILGVRRDYDCFDLRFREFAGVRWEVRYDPDDLTQVLAVSEDGRQRFMMEEKYVQPMALADRTEGDAEALQRIINYNKALEERVHDRLAIAQETAARLRLPQHNILSKVMLTDSDGQHKSRRKALEQAAVDAEFEDLDTPRAIESEGSKMANTRFGKY